MQHPTGSDESQTVSDPSSDCDMPCGSSQLLPLDRVFTDILKIIVAMNKFLEVPSTILNMKP